MGGEVNARNQTRHILYGAVGSIDTPSKIHDRRKEKLQVKQVKTVRNHRKKGENLTKPTENATNEKDVTTRKKGKEGRGY